MSVNTLGILSILLTAILIGSSFAHLLELPNKIHLPPNTYLMVQQLYRGWALLGIAVLAALVATVALAVQLQAHRPSMFPLVGGAAACIVASLIVFFVFTFPANRITENWTKLPQNWERLRRRWEYSHAANAGLYLLALVLLTFALVR